MQQYLDLCKKVLENGLRKPNRTGTDHIGTHGEMLQFDLKQGFPAVTTKKLVWKATVAELLCFIRGVNDAGEFRSLGCRFWDANANEPGSETNPNEWVLNPNRKGHDDLGRIYGVQARGFRGWDASGNPVEVDQLRSVIKRLQQKIDDRRLIVTHMNPAELDQMALPPCHMFYQFGIEGDQLNMAMYQRAADLPLGAPVNIASYALLQSIVAKIVGLKPGVFTHFIWDAHIYANQLEGMREQVKRKPYPLPRLEISDRIQTLEDVETIAGIEDFKLHDYEHHPAISYPFAL